MANIETWFEQDLMNPVTVRNVGSIFSQDSLGNLIGVRVKKDGEDYILSGSVNGYCILADGSTVPVIGTRSGSEASIILPASAYSVTGPIAIAIKLTDGNAITTLAACVGIVTRSRTGVQIDPGQTVTDWTNQIAAALQEVIDTSAAQDVKIDELKSAFEHYAQNTIPVESGSISDSTGAKTTGTTRIRTKCLFGIGEYAYIEAPTGFKLITYCYDENNDYLGYTSYKKAIVPQNDILSVRSATKYFYCVFRKDDATTSNISAYIPTIEQQTILHKNTTGADLLVGGNPIAANTNLNSILNVGNYYCPTNAIASSLENCPTLRGFTMKVRYSEGINNGYIVQEITNVIGDKYIRALIDVSNVVFNPWKKENATAPSLTEAEKTAIVNLALSYWQARDNFFYNGAMTRNDYAAAEDAIFYVEEKGRDFFKINCSGFVQLVMMGRSASDFSDLNNYSNVITKAFDWGYYFDFDQRAIYGLQPPNATPGEAPIDYYGFRNPLESETYEGSYSYNSYYSKYSQRPKKQVFNTFMYANDMALEMERKGYTIPFSELQKGDIIFSKTPLTPENTSFSNVAYKGISHVAIVTDVTSDHIHFVESGGTYTYSISRCGTDFEDSDGERGEKEWDWCRSRYLLDNIVLCARHPRAWLKQSNVPNTITVI